MSFGDAETKAQVQQRDTALAVEGDTTQSLSQPLLGGDSTNIRSATMRTSTLATLTSTVLARPATIHNLFTPRLCAVRYGSVFLVVFLGTAWLVGFNILYIIAFTGKNISTGWKELAAVALAVLKTTFLLVVVPKV